MTAALAADPSKLGLMGWLRSLLEGKSSKKEAMAVAAPPRVVNDEGWTMIHCDDEEAFNEWLDKDSEGLPYRPGEEPSLGSHLLIELFGCNGSTLEKDDTVGEAMVGAARVSEATIVAECFKEFKPYGVSGAVIIQESHYTIHTWPEHGYAAVDLFYCGGTVKVRRAVELLKEKFEPRRIKFLVVRRGSESEVLR
ncbi:MAG TPA: adenosylmethionine decarboxylase [Fimbriimonas sp.]|nr:adenosylmethionine decarboxylase [Fimbriimonas sp.]